MEGNGFTATQRKMLAVLADGLPHSRHELKACLYDDQGHYSNVRVHLSSIRQKIRPRGQDIICEYYKRTLYYRHVRLLASATDGKR